MRVLSFMFCAVLLMGASTVWAYDEIQVTEGGTIVGKVTMEKGAVTLDVDGVSVPLYAIQSILPPGGGS